VFGPTPFIGRSVVASFHDSADSALATVTVPATVEAGDLLVLLDSARAVSGTVTKVVPTDFDEIVSDDLSINPGVPVHDRVVWSMKLAEAGDAGASITGMDATNDAKLLLVFRGDRPFKSATSKSAVADATQSNPSAQVVPVTTGGGSLICLGAYIEAAGPPDVGTRTFTIASVDAKDDEIENSVLGLEQWVAYKLFNPGITKADVTVDMIDEDTASGAVNILASCFIEVR
jgi:hypothetical protein